MKLSLICLLKKQVHRVGLPGTRRNILDLFLWDMHIKIMPALKDNYMYMIIDKKTREAAVVDPADPQAVVKEVKKENLNLTRVLTTHHHSDHAGGNEKLQLLYDKPLIVYGNDERIPGQNCKLMHGDCFKIGQLSVRCLGTPGHTKGHLCYYIKSPNFPESVVFTGDALFQGGCGRFVEGSPEQMYETLYMKLNTLPADTKIFGGHENTLENINFAHKVEPTNEAILKRIESVRKQRSITVPSTIAQERLWNPFMRVHEPGVQFYARASDPIATLRNLRRARDNFTCVLCEK